MALQKLSTFVSYDALRVGYITAGDSVIKWQTDWSLAVNKLLFNRAFVHFTAS